MSFLKNNLFPALLWGALSACLLRWERDPIAILLILRAGLVMIAFLMRLEASRRASLLQRVVSWGSALLPLLLSTKGETPMSQSLGLLVFIAGTTLVCLSCIDLGRSFGVSPSVRPFVVSGIYRWVRHPMYLGHFITELGIFILAPSPRNLLLVVAGWALYLLRLRWEDRLHQNKAAANGSNLGLTETAGTVLLSR